MDENGEIPKPGQENSTRINRVLGTLRRRGGIVETAISEQHLPSEVLAIREYQAEVEKLQKTTLDKVRDMTQWVEDIDTTIAKIGGERKGDWKKRVAIETILNLLAPYGVADVLGATRIIASLRRSGFHQETILKLLALIGPWWPTLATQEWVDNRMAKKKINQQG